ncbi:MAG TPA: hypothetical protein VKP30_03125, partial [Polyangiaceae bacterium]|nr:hypothetical protein [Polyangiaceae bacterium]
VATFRRRDGSLGTASLKTAESIGVNMFTPESVTRTLATVGFVDVHVHHDAARWMILSGAKG